MSDDKLELLQNCGILAAHHRELTELAVEDVCDITARLVEVGDDMDAAIYLATVHGATIFELFHWTKLPVSYLLRASTV